MLERSHKNEISSYNTRGAQTASGTSPKKIHVVIDSDTYNEVDDQFAISYAMLSPEKIQMEAIYAAPFPQISLLGLMQTDGVAIPMTGNLKEGLELSYQEILKLLGLLGREDFKDRVFRGSERYMTVKDQPVDSDAARDLVKRVHECEDVLYVIANWRDYKRCFRYFFDGSRNHQRKWLLYGCLDSRCTGRMQLSLTLTGRAGFSGNSG